MISMPRTPENLVRHELIGLDVAVQDATDPTLDGMGGTVVDETRQTLVIATDTGEKRVAKDVARFSFALDQETVTIDGGLLVARPHERILKKLPRKWEYRNEANTSG